MIRIVLPAHLRTLARVGEEVEIQVEDSATQRSVLDLSLIHISEPTRPY